MASVVFFRAVNVGGHQKFQPSRLAKELAALEVVNVGAAGTLVVRAKVNATRLRAEILRHLPFKPELMICPSQHILALAATPLFQRAPVGKNLTRFVSVLPQAPPVPPKLPLLFPASGKWEVQLVAVVGNVVLSVRRPGPKGLYPNAVVEKSLGMVATTRNWNTIETICRVLEA